jgi:hypothetical protein
MASARFAAAACAIAALVAVGGGAVGPRPGPTGGTYDPPRSFIYFGLERERISEEAFLDNEGVVGAQLKYTWRELEPERGRYAFESIERDLAFLESYEKQLFIQIQDVSFDGDRINVPDYLLSDPAYHGGAALQYYLEEDDPKRPVPEGWVARRWDPAVRGRFSMLLDALATSFDGRIAGLNLPETSIGFGLARLWPEGYTPAAYYAGILELMDSAAYAFTHSPVVLYANFMPGEELPDDDHGYLKGVYAHAEAIGLGVGGPDLLPNRWFQRQHSLPLIAGRSTGTVAGVAVQWGNLEDRNRETGERVTVDDLYEYARDELRLDFIFWGTQEPFYSRDILPYLASLAGERGASDAASQTIPGRQFLALQVRDIEEMSAWYGDVFGLQEVSRLASGDGRYAIRILTDGSLTVELIHETRSAEPPERHYGIFKAGLRVAGIDALHERLLARGVQTDERIFADSALGVRSFVFQDLEGNRLQAFEEAGGTP